MLRVTIDLIPFGKEEDKKELSKITIENVGKSPLDNYSKYKYNGYIDNFGTIRNIFGNIVHNRRDNALILLYEILENYFFEGK
jgi:hypothetical protein